MLTFFAGQAARGAAIAAAMVTLAGCETSLMGGSPVEGIGFREARNAEITAILEYRACRDEAVALAVQAREAASPARYVASARVLDGCEADLGSEAAQIPQQERMQAYALGIQNYLKGGDLTAARSNLDSFQSAFPGHDLYLADGSSFIATMEVLLGVRDRADLAVVTVANVGEPLKGEIRRWRYWNHN